MNRLKITQRTSTNSRELPSSEQVKFQMDAMRLILTQRADKNEVTDFSFIPVYYAIYQMFKFQDRNSSLSEIIIGEIKNIVLLAVEDKSEDYAFRKTLSIHIDNLLKDPLVYDKMDEFMSTNYLYPIL